MDTAVVRGRPGYSRDDVVRIAVEEFNAHGYEATSMGALAKTLGISKSAIYHHISSKEQILQEATGSALDLLEEVLDAAAVDAPDARERLQRIIVGSTVVLCEKTPEVTLLLRLRGNSEVELAAMERRRDVTRSLIEAIADAQEGGYVRSDLRPGFIGRLIFGMVNSIANWYAPAGDLSPDDVAEGLSKLVFEGIQRV